jgi:hypothetical protein
MAADAVAAALDREPQYVYIRVELSGRDLKNIRRILGKQYEPLKDAWLMIRVKSS